VIGNDFFTLVSYPYKLLSLSSREPVDPYPLLFLRRSGQGPSARRQGRGSVGRRRHRGSASSGRAGGSAGGGRAGGYAGSLGGVRPRLASYGRVARGHRLPRRDELREAAACLLWTGVTSP
jgi:hypothetical protein